MRIQMDQHVFTIISDSRNGLVYDNCRPGDNSGIYIKKEDVDKLKAYFNDRLEKIHNQAMTLAAVEKLEYCDKNFLCDAKKLNDEEKTSS